MGAPVKNETYVCCRWGDPEGNLRSPEGFGRALGWWRHQEGSQYEAEKVVVPC